MTASYSSGSYTVACVCTYAQLDFPDYAWNIGHPNVKANNHLLGQINFF